MDEFRTVKGLITQIFEVEMLQDEHGRYCIRYAIRNPVYRDYYSEWITDYGTASYMFDLKIKDLEGN